MKPVLENPALTLELVDMVTFVVWHPSAQHMVVCAFDHGDGIDLHIAELLDGFQRCAFAAAEGFAFEQALPIKGNSA